MLQTHLICGISNYIRFTYVFERVRQREREGQRGHYHLLIHKPKPCIVEASPGSNQEKLSLLNWCWRERENNILAHGKTNKQRKTDDNDLDPEKKKRKISGQKTNRFV